MIAFAKNSDIQKWFEAKNMSRSNSTQNKPEGYPYEDADFYPKYQEVCQICGISSFAHRHKAGSLPKDFERLPEASKTKERASGEDIPRWSERLQKAYDQGYADARREGHPTINGFCCACECLSLKRKPNKDCLNHEKIWNGNELGQTIDELARLMVEKIANNIIEVDTTSEGRSAQRHWYLVAQKMLKKLMAEYKRVCKEEYHG